MSSAPRITYRPRPDATPEGEVAALATIYKFLLFDHHTEEKGGPITAPDAQKEINNGWDEQTVPDG